MAVPLAPGELFPAGAPNIFARTLTLATGVRVRIAESGPRDGPPLVCLHGWAGSLYMYRHALELLPAHGVRVIAVDLRGYGLSDKPPAPNSYSLNNYCADLDALFDALALSRAGLIGQSMGGGLALRYALARPDRVSKLVLINPIGLTPVAILPVVRAMPSGLVDALGRRFVPRWVIAFMLRRVVYNDPTRVAERDVDEYWAPTQLPGFVHAARAGLSEFDWRPLSADEAASLAVPSMVILGAQDRLLHGVYGAAKRLRGSHIVTLTGGHCVHEEHPGPVYSLVAEFVR